MANTLTKILLAPLLLWQGKQVRRCTPRLPEADGAREGEIRGEQPPLRVLICGDSAAAGVGVSGQHQALSGQLLRELQRYYPHRAITWKLWAKNGDTTANTLIKLHLKPAETFDVVITSLGVNDVTSGTRKNRFYQQQLALVRLLLSKYKAQQVILTALPPMHLFPALPQPLRFILGNDAKALTHQLHKVALLISKCSVLQVNFPLTANTIAADGFHPGLTGYQLWAQAIARKIHDGLGV